MAELVILGGSGLVGGYLIPLLPPDQPFLVLGRHPPKAGPVAWRPFDPDEGELATAAPEARILLHLAPLPLLPRLLRRRLPRGIKRIVALGTTSSRFKRNSHSDRERRIAGEQIEAEAATIRWADAAGVAWTLLRPTLTYGMGDRNISRMAGFIRRYRFFPIVGGGTGLRQPLYAGDLAQGCLDVLGCSRTHGRSYDLGGGETLTYRAMVDRVFESQGQPPRVMNLPRPLVRAGLRVGSHHPGWRFVDPEMADRMVADLVVDPRPARDDFGFDPDRFRPERCFQGTGPHV